MKLAQLYLGRIYLSASPLGELLIRQVTGRRSVCSLIYYIHGRVTSFFYFAATRT